MHRLHLVLKAPALSKDSKGGRLRLVSALTRLLSSRMRTKPSSIHCLSAQYNSSTRLITLIIVPGKLSLVLPRHALTICATNSQETRKNLGTEPYFQGSRCILRECGMGTPYLAVLSIGVAEHEVAAEDLPPP